MCAGVPIMKGGLIACHALPEKQALTSCVLSQQRPLQAVLAVAGSRRLCQGVWCPDTAALSPASGKQIRRTEPIHMERCARPDTGGGFIASVFMYHASGCFENCPVAFVAAYAKDRAAFSRMPPDRLITAIPHAPSTQGAIANADVWLLSKANGIHIYCHDSFPTLIHLNRA